jgi:hypothetical protein
MAIHNSMLELCRYAVPIAIGLASKSLDPHRVFQHPQADALIDPFRLVDALGKWTCNVRTLSELPRGETRERQHCRWVSFDRAVSSESLAFAADAVFYGISIGLLLSDRVTTAWERHR